MTFHTPAILLLLAIVPVGVVVHLLLDRRKARFASPALMPAVAPKRPRWRRHVPLALQALAVAGLIVALARPQTTEAVPVNQATVVVATDRSGSMQATDVAPTRLQAARKAADTFLDAVPKDVRVGAIAFNQTPTVLQSPTRDHAAVKEAIDAVTPAGSTATGDALNAALKLVKNARTAASTQNPTAKPAPAAIVLLSDGKSVRGSDALTIADQAKAAKVPVYTVALGTANGTITTKRANGSTAQTPVPPDPATLKQIAEKTGGKSFAIEDAGELEQVYKQLGSQLATEKKPVEQTSMFAGGALLILLTGVAGSLRWFGRPI